MPLFGRDGTRAQAGVADHPDRVDHCRVVQDMDDGEPLGQQPPRIGKAPANPLDLPSYHRGLHDPAASPRIALLADGLRQVQDDGRDRASSSDRELQEGPPGARRDVRRVHDAQSTALEPVRKDAPEDIERRRRGRLIRLIVADKCAERVGGKHLR